MPENGRRPAGQGGPLHALLSERLENDRRQVISDGKQVGEWTTWYQNGQRSAIDQFQEGLQDGLHLSWYDNGQPAAQGTYVKGKREGTWKRWDSNGFRNWNEVYKDDKKIS